ncbi:hypothetical protein H0H87_002867 [Tephrocybe sp. NHM501043]|nr:hypothetical protein H0H87_002867 [Tephrocybe sp. NHM501043]
MSEWIDIKAEDSVSNFLPSDLPGAEPGVYLPAAEAHLPSSGHSVSLPPDPEHVFQGRPAATPSERQRTVQACDKCRERKTKYSSREPRTRGPSKARLRNAVSSTDLRASSNARSFSHNPQHTQQLLHYDSQVYDTLPDYRSLRRVASIPISFQDEPRGLPIDPTFESYAPPFALNETSTTYHTPPLNYTQPDPRTSQLRDMRRVQSHSTLIGSQRGSLSRNTPSYPSFRSPENFSGQTYGQQWSSQGRISPPSLPLFDTTVDQLLPPAPRVDHATQRRQSPKVHPWGYHSDGSTG